MEFRFTVGERLIVELITTQIYEGDYLSGGKDRIELINICDHDTGNKLQGNSFSFYRNEIANIKILSKQTPEQDIKHEEEEVIDEKNVAKTIAIPKLEYERLKELTQSYIYMATLDKRYEDAMEHLNNCETVGVLALSSGFGRSSNIDLLVISCWDQIYLFDIFLYNKNKFPEGLKHILESHDIKKVVHDSKSITDCLYHCYEIKIHNLFDTLVADEVLSSKESTDSNVRNLGECLTYYFNFPSNLLQKAMAVEMKKWKERPLSDGRKLFASQLAVYLISLKNHLETLMLKDFYKEVQRYSTSAINCSESEAHNLVSISDIKNSLHSLSLNE